jgi:hypothetical protein
MSRGNGVHTVPNPDGKGWVNEVGGSTITNHRTQETASEVGRREAIRRETEHFIHNREGRIRERNSYGNDPSVTLQPLHVGANVGRMLVPWPCLVTKMFADLMSRCTIPLACAAARASAI